MTTTTTTWRRPYTKTYNYNDNVSTSRYKSEVETLNKRSCKYLRRSFDEKETAEALKEAKSKLAEMEKEESEKPHLTPLWKKHPYYYPVEHEYSLPHESSVWPESRPHFDLVSSYDVMIGYLGLRPQDRPQK